MSMHASLLMIEGNHLDRLKEIFEDFGYADTGQDKVVGQFEDLPAVDQWVISRTRERNTGFFSQGWTVIMNAMVMLAYEETCSQLSKKLNSRIFGMVCEGTSGSYGFWLYDRDKKRSFLSTDGEITDNFGEPLPGESALNKNDIFEDDILLLMKSLGFDYDQISKVNHFIIKELDVSTFSIEQSEKSKPWWKFC